MEAPVVSFEGFQSADRQKILDTVSNVDRAMSDCGFMASSDLGFSDELIARVFEASATFFLSDAKYKMRSAYLSACLLYTSPSPRDRQKSRMPSSA